jgi:NAD(P)H dehydrogenase (quinone)
MEVIMTTILIVYESDYGNTKTMAETIAAGAETVPDTTVVLKEAVDVTAEDVTAADGVVVGTPVHMGGPDWRIKKFIDSVCSGLWMEDKMTGKVAGVFATGSGFGNTGGGGELTLLSMLNNFAELGMVIVPLPKNTPGYPLGGLQWGPVARSAGVNMEQTGVGEETLEAAGHHGANVARVTAALKGNSLFAQ